VKYVIIIIKVIHIIKYFLKGQNVKRIYPLYKSNNDKAHKIINYDKRIYICNKNYDNYNSYCEKCKIN